MALDKKINKHYISPIDLRLDQFDRREPLSASQRAEIEKYKRIYALRDVPTFDIKEEPII